MTYLVEFSTRLNKVTNLSIIVPFPATNFSSWFFLLKELFSLVVVWRLLPLSFPFLVESSLALGTPSLGVPRWREITFWVGGIIFHALCHLQQLLACFQHLMHYLWAQGFKMLKKATLWVYYSFITTKHSNALNIWMCFASKRRPSPCLKANNSNPSFRTWLWRVNFTLNSPSNPTHIKVRFVSRFSSLNVPHHLNAWSRRKDWAN